MKNYFMLMMGGSGTRFGASIPKQFVKVKEKPIYEYILDSLDCSSLVDGIVIVSHFKWIEYLEQTTKKYKKVIKIVSGGDCRSKSVYNGFQALSSIAKLEDNVLIHDATHPHIDFNKLPTLVDKINSNLAASMVTSIYDTCYLKDEEGNIIESIDRKKIAVGASPEGFKYSVLDSIFSNTTNEELEQMTSIGAMVSSKGVKIAIVESDLLNLKITYSNDMKLFSLLCDNYYKFQ